MLGPDVVVTHETGLIDRKLQHLLGPWREGNIARDHRGSAHGQVALHLALELLEVNTELLKHGDCDAPAVFDYAQQDVLRAEILVVAPLGFLPGQDDDLAGPLGEALKHVFLLYECVTPACSTMTPSSIRTTRSNWAARASL